MKKIMIILLLFLLIGCTEENNTGTNKKNQINEIVEVTESTLVENTKEEEDEQVNTDGIIHLYGEAHSVDVIIDEELKLWGEYYNKGYRHLFVEQAYYTAEYLNLYLRSDEDEYLQFVYKNLKGTMSYHETFIKFFETIKKEYPETVLHGTDLGHQYGALGIPYKNYLIDNGLQDSQAYDLTLEAIEQGKTYYKTRDHVYRENKMAENFMREFNALEDKSIMGIYGGAHTDLDGLDYNTASVPNMASQLNQTYDGQIESVDLRLLLLMTEPLSVEMTEIGGKSYEASYFGQHNMKFKDYDYKRIWRIENAYDEFKDYDLNEDVLPYNNYPMSLDVGEVYKVELTLTNGETLSLFYRSDGTKWRNMDTTVGFDVD